MKTLHGVILSPYVRKVRIVLEEKQLDYTIKPVLPFNADAAFKKISPLSKIPVFTEGEKDLADSTVIAAYLEKAYPDVALYPSDAYAYAKALWFEEYADTALSDVAVRDIFFAKLIGPAMLGLPLDMSAIESAYNEALPPLLTYLQTQLADNAYFVGDSFSMADIAVTMPFINMQHAGYSLDADRWPSLAAYLEQQMQRSSIAKCIEEEQAFLKSFIR